MKSRWSLSFAAAALLGLTAAFAAPPASSVGPDVAVVDITVGKEKQPRQIIIGFYDNAAPATVANFKELIGRRFYNGIRVHRVFPNNLVQTGDPITRIGWFRTHRPIRAGTGGPGFTVPAEIGLPHLRGSVAMARVDGLPNPAKVSNGSQFFICLQPSPKLDGKFTVFGEVLEGLDILDEISNLPADSNDFPLPNVVIRSIKIVPRFSEAARP